MTSRAVVLLVATLLASCASDDAATKASGTAPAGCLPSKWPDRAVIDPDAPEFADDTFSREQVSSMFSRARADGTAAYRAYRAARDHADVLACGYCACGCASDGHLSALDCFKEMHGFG